MAMRQTEDVNTAEETSPARPSGKRPGGKVFLILFLTVFALGFGALGAEMIGSAYGKEKAYSASVQGRIIDYRSSSYNNRHEYSPVVEYRAKDQVFTGETNVRYNYRPFEVGESVAVCYDPERPDKFYIREYDLETTYALGAIFLLVAIGLPAVCILCAVLGRIKTDREKKEQTEAKIIVGAALLFLFTVFCFLAGPEKALGIFATFGLFCLYGMHHNKRKK